VGLFTGLLTLPLAPVRGTMWIAEQVAAQAARELGDEATIRRQLAELELRHDLGEIDDDEYEQAEDALLERLLSAREAAQEAERDSNADAREGHIHHGS
jgi:cytochrome c-type biogenesis protein CcmI